VKALFVLLACVALFAALLGGAGVVTMLVESRLSALAPGGLTATALHYNPLSGSLDLRGVVARDGAGREVFRAERVVATAAAANLFGGALLLQRVQIAAPRLIVGAAPALTLIGLRARASAPPLSVSGLVVTHGDLLIEDDASRAPLVVRDFSARLDRLSAFGDEAAFASEMALYGASVRATGQPVGGGAYAVRVRATGLDAPALLRDFPLAGNRIQLAEGRAAVDATVLLAGGRVLLSGQLKIDDVVARFVDAPRTPLRAAGLVLVVDGWDLEASTGRISRLELRRPILTLTLDHSPPAAVSAALELLSSPEVALRRLRIVDGTVKVVGAKRPPLTLRGVTLGLQSAAESGPHARYVLTARAGLTGAGRITVDGALSRDFRHAEGAARAIGVTLQDCGIDDLSVPLPADASPRALLDVLTLACGKPL
jgi:hypothetical protein